MLMNLYLTPLDTACSADRYLRYADDIVDGSWGRRKFR